MTCSQCGKRAKYKRQREDKKVDAGLCITCGKPADNPFKNSCEKCRKEHSKYRSGLKAKNERDGLCNKCGRPRRPGYVTCEKCAERNLRWARHWYYKHGGLKVAQRRRAAQARQRKLEKHSKTQ